MKTKDITNIIALVLIILGLTLIFWKLVGGSPTEFSILIALVSGVLFKVMSISTDLSGLKERVRNIDNKFKALASDFKEHVKHK